MNVEIWKGVCNGLNTTYDTKVDAYRSSGLVFIEQQGGDAPGEDPNVWDCIVMDEAQAIDVALCILRELAPGFYQALGDMQ